MKTRAAIVGVLIVVMATMPACRVRNPEYCIEDDLAHYVEAATKIEYPELSPCDADVHELTPPPFQISDFEQAEFRNLSLQEAVQIALANSPVLRDLGGTVLRTPATVRTAYDPAVIETDPRFGIEAALSAFDTDFNTRIFAEQNDRRLNNQFLGNLGFLNQNYGVWEAELQKRAATGSQFILRKNVEFDKNSSLGNEFDDGWTVILEGEARQPLLQGAGLPFNRMAGPDGSAGAINGVLIARVKTDISLAEFELGVRSLIANVENAYWDLYYAYRDLDAKISARDAALVYWRKVMANFGRKSYTASVETQARAQYFQFKLEVEDALTGKLLEGTRTNNGSSGGTFRGSPGIYVNERRLRLIMGIPVNDGRLIRPQDEPPTARVVFDWGRASAEALFRRPELRRTKWEVKRREMELAASQNLLLPNLDMVGRYRFRGFGDSLINSYRNAGKAPDLQFDNAFQSLTSGRFQEWQLGFEFSMPFGFRQAHSAVRNAELQLARSRAVLREQEHQILHDLSDSISDVDRAYVTMDTSYNRLRATKAQLDSVAVEIEGGEKEADAPLFALLLQSQRQFAQAQTQFYQTQVEYALSLKNVHFEKGTLLDYCGVMLSEGAWPNKAFVDAMNRECRRGREHKVRTTRHNPPFVSQGPYHQESLMEPGTGAELPFDPFADDPQEPFNPVPLGDPDSPPLPDQEPAGQNDARRTNDEAVFTPLSKWASKLTRIGRTTHPDAADSDDASQPRVSAPVAEAITGEVIGPRATQFQSPPPPPWYGGVATSHGWHAPHDGPQPAVQPGASPPWAGQGGRLNLPDNGAPPPPWIRPSPPAAPADSILSTRPWGDGSHPPRADAAVSVHVAGEGERQRATTAGQWTPANGEHDAVAGAPPVSQTPVPFAPSLRLLPERRVGQTTPPDPSAPQLRIRSQEPPRRLPPVE